MSTPSSSTPPSPSSISLQVNGEEKTCEPTTTLPQFLEQIGMNPKLVAVEYNGEILHRQFWAEAVLEEGDRLEVVTIVGGGSAQVAATGLRSFTKFL